MRHKSFRKKPLKAAYRKFLEEQPKPKEDLLAEDLLAKLLASNHYGFSTSDHHDLFMPDSASEPPMPRTWAEARNLIAKVRQQLTGHGPPAGYGPKEPRFRFRTLGEANNTFNALSPELQAMIQDVHLQNVKFRV